MAVESTSPLIPSEADIRARIDKITLEKKQLLALLRLVVKTQQASKELEGPVAP